MTTAIKLIEPTENEFLASFEGKYGRNHLLRMMAHRPEVLKTILPFYGAVMGPGSIEQRLKELIYLTVSFTNNCAYCKASHIKSGRKPGITENDIRAIATEEDNAFSARERVAIQYARDLTRTANADHSREALCGFFGDEQIVEITLVAAVANFTNRFNNGLELAVEEAVSE
jgi:uncharacterized peroxidase-related enzyme